MCLAWETSLVFHYLTWLSNCLIIDWPTEKPISWKDLSCEFSFAIYLSTVVILGDCFYPRLIVKRGGHGHATIFHFPLLGFSNLKERVISGTRPWDFAGSTINTCLFLPCSLGGVPLLHHHPAAQDSQRLRTKAIKQVLGLHSVPSHGDLSVPELLLRRLHGLLCLSLGQGSLMPGAVPFCHHIMDFLAFLNNNYSSPLSDSIAAKSYLWS